MEYRSSSSSLSWSSVADRRRRTTLLAARRRRAGARPCRPASRRSAARATTAPRRHRAPHPTPALRAAGTAVAPPPEGRPPSRRPADRDPAAVGGPAGPAARPAGPVAVGVRLGAARPAVAGHARRRDLGGDRGHPDHRRRGRRRPARQLVEQLRTEVKVLGTRTRTRCGRCCGPELLEPGRRRTWTGRCTPAPHGDRPAVCWWSASTAPARPPPAASWPGS